MRSVKKRLVFIIIGISILLNATKGVCADADLLFRKGYEAAMKRNWRTAEEFYSRSIDIAPENYEVFMQRAVVREMLEKHPEALQDYRKTLTLKPDYYLAWEYLGKLYERYGEYENARKCYEEGLKLVRDAKWRGIVRDWISRVKKLSKKKSSSSKNRQGAQTSNKLY